MNLFRKKTRVKFRLQNSDMQIGYLVKDKMYAGGFKVITTDGKNGHAVCYLEMLEKI